MLSAICQKRNNEIIPNLLGTHDAVLYGEGGVIDLSTAENWSVKEKVVPRIRERLGNLSDENLAYASGIGGCTETRTHIANLLNTRFDPFQQVDPSHVVLGAGGSFALTALVDQICDPGDAILIAAPYWAGLDISLSVHSRARVIPVNVPLDVFFEPDSVHYYESALQSTTLPVKAVLLCNPHNPLGRCYPYQTLRAMRQFCASKGLHYISDEVYALSAHYPMPEDVAPFTSMLKFDPGEDGYAGSHVHVIYSLSKDFGCNGIRVGALINQTSAPIRMSTALSVHSQTSTLSTYAASSLLESPEVIDEITTYGGCKSHESYLVMRLFLERRNIHFVSVNYGMFVFARLVKLDDATEEAKLQRCFKARGVSVSPGASYHFQEPGWFRICYGLPVSDLERGLTRLVDGISDYLRGSGSLPETPPQ